MNILLNLVGSLIIVIFGYLLVKLIYPTSKNLEAVGLGYLIAIGLFTFIMFLGNLIGIPFKLINSSIILVTLILVLFITHWVKNRTNLINLSFSKKRLGNKINSITVIDIVPLLLIIFLIASSFISNFFWPVRDWDSLVLYDFRAKTFVATGYMQDGISRGYFFGYPLFTSLSHTWLYLIGSKNPMPIYSFLYSSFLTVSYFIFRKNASRTLSLIFVAILAVSPELYRQSQISYTNLPYTVYYVLGVGFIYLWSEYKTLNYLTISALLIGLSTWIRSTEPFWITVVALVFFLAFIFKKYLHGLIFIVIILTILLPWKIYEASNSSTNGTVLVQIGAVIDTLLFRFDPIKYKDILIFFIKYNIEPYLLSFLIFLILLLYNLVIFSKQFFHRSLILMLITANLSILFISSYTLSFYYAEIWKIPDSFTRLSMFFPPLIIFALSNFFQFFPRDMEKY